MTWSLFTCENPDFAVRSIPDDVLFRVRRAALDNSEVFRWYPYISWWHNSKKVLGDMFICCDQLSNETLSLDEPVQVLSALLQLLHYHPVPIIEVQPVTISIDSEDEDVNDTPSFNRERFMTRVPSYDYKTVIPLPVLQPTLFDLADKYGLSIDIFRALCSHLLAHAPTHPLRVYGFAASFECHHQRCRKARPSPSVIEENSSPADQRFGIDAEKEMEKEMRKVASKASQFLEPVGSYPMEEVLDAIPDVRALHRVVRLQHLRVKVLRDALNESEIFPKGYGTCLSHRENTMDCWDRQRKALAGKIDSGTDVAGEMELFVDTLAQCKTCHKAGVAAVEMLAYVCYRLLLQVQHAAWLA
ncbi:hypothetical protein AGABI1DRAFT_123764 [Agaricus bisporus var. burnettii JB137-S8]|uniref:Uncharacterized protein n=1 Tax=Agaricus bisporus var. burnettii (strain JB137-S8 / ATCC MYA-4627 / FGSC 10392) TaxID=597362 RepID=K5Y5P1_AGABU|nr:uncharacterized protein AGABI1DRAFT_123764 [Agaricus bisporus var. burnettii JB137-S8]EKM83435.1 hypothetical protein AGABI1DRAFT_123764 [Agaricus bisporus var. burnettii JB137-S8]